MKEYLKITNEDNMQLMKRYPDNYFDLAIVDPPYGIKDKIVTGGLTKKRKSKFHRNDDCVKWDNLPSTEYFEELFRVSKNQIIWGSNYFNLPPTRCNLIWDKMQEFTGADFELAWTSFDKASKAFRMSRIEAYSKGKVHPTEKPIALYGWIFKNYADANQKILDTHLGSGNIAIALDSFNKIEKMNITLTACELDEKIFKIAIQNVEEKTKWNSLF
jgi:site-specific DNA-methyltransferase (adenine-specific)